MTTLSITTVSATAPIYARLTVMAALWAGTFVAGRMIAPDMAPLPVAIGRFGLAVIGLMILAKHIEGGLPRLTLRQAGVTCLLGVTGVFLYNLFFLTALSELPASRTAIFVSLNPVVVSVFMVIAFRERLSAIRWIGIALTSVGALLIISRGEVSALLHDLGHSFGRGERAMILAVIAWALYTVIGKRALTDLSALAATTYAAIWGLVLFCVAFLIAPVPVNFGQISAHSIGLIVYLAIGGTVIPFLWYYRGVIEIGPARTSVFTNLVPVFGVLFGVVLLGEPLSLSMLVGGGVVICGVALTNRP